MAPGNHQPERTRTEEDDERRSQAEINRDHDRRFGQLERFAQENAEAIHGNGQPDLMDRSMQVRLADLEKRLKRAESIINKGFGLLCTAAVAGFVSIVKLVAGAAASLLTRDKP